MSHRSEQHATKCEMLLVRDQWNSVPFGNLVSECLHGLLHGILAQSFRFSLTFYLTSEAQSVVAFGQRVVIESAHVPTDHDAIRASTTGVPPCVSA